MAVRYLLPCECGNSIPVDVNQAGNSVVCSCGKSLEVPSLRAMRELPPHVDASHTGKPLWTPAAGMMFASGVVIALIGVGVAVFMHLNSVRAGGVEPPTQEDVAAWIAEVDSMSPELLLDDWNASRHMGLGDHQLSPFVQARRESQRYAMMRNVALIVVASGLIFAGASIWMRRRPA